MTTTKEPNVQKLSRLHVYYSRKYKQVESVRFDLRALAEQIARIAQDVSNSQLKPQELQLLEQRRLELEGKRTELRARETELEAFVKSAISVRTRAEEWLEACGLAIPAENGARHYNGPVGIIDDESAQKLSSLRGRIAELKASAKRIEVAWPMAKLLIAEKHLQIDRLLDPICQPDFDISRHCTADDLQLLSIAANAAQLKEAIAARIEQITPPDALSPEEKAQRLEKIGGEILALEIEEESICVALEEKHVEVIRRRDLTPEVFLEVA